MMHKFKFVFRPKAPYNFNLTAHPSGWWWAFTPFEVFNEGRLWTATTFDKRFFGLKIWSTGMVKNPKVKTTVYSRSAIKREEKLLIKEELKWMLGVDVGVKEFYSMAKRDRILKNVVSDMYGMRVPQSSDLFGNIILAITLQMAPWKRTEQMMNSLIKLYGQRITFDGKTVYSWPTPKKITKVSVKELKEKCKLGYRAKNLRAVAELLNEREFPSYRELRDMTEEQAKKKLLELPGIGDYSADIVTPHPGSPIDVWSAKIFHVLFFGKEPKKPRDIIPEIKREAERRWGEWKWYAFVYIVNDLKNLSERFGFDFTKF